MGWSLGWDNRWKRDIGYGVPAWCDHPKCNAEIDRGLGYVCCDSQVGGGDRGCGLFFCGKHTDYRGRCPRCRNYQRPYKITKPEHPRWLRWKLTDGSWAEWRSEHPQEVEAMWRSLHAQENEAHATA